MSEVLQANVFFFITAAAVIVLTVFLSIALFHIIKITRSIRRIVERIEIGSEVLADDMEKVRSVVTGTSSMLVHLLGLKSMIRATRKSDEDDVEDVSDTTRQRRKKRRTKLSIKDET